MKNLFCQDSSSQCHIKFWSHPPLRGRGEALGDMGCHWLFRCALLTRNDDTLSCEGKCMESPRQVAEKESFHGYWRKYRRRQSVALRLGVNPNDRRAMLWTLRSACGSLSPLRSGCHRRDLFPALDFRRYKSAGNSAKNPCRNRSRDNRLRWLM